MPNEEEKLTPPDLPEAPRSVTPDFKITTGEGRPPEFPVAPAPSAPPQPDFFSPETIGPSPIPEGVTEKRSVLKFILIGLAAVVLVGGIGALGYFVVFPLVFGPGGPEERPPVVTQPVLATHKSFLVGPVAAEAEIKLSDTNYLTIANTLQNESFNQLADGQYKEVQISDANGQVPFSKYLNAIVPATSALGVSDLFEDDFTAVLYYDALGVWPVYVAKIKSGVNKDNVMTGFKTLENIFELSNFYLIPPGAFSAFKDGKAGNYATRYSVGAQSGAAFNYGVFGNYFILSTNYNGLKGVLPLLGL